MALMLKNGLVYMHIPKTGGNWLTSLLEKNDLVTGAAGHKHATYEALVCTDAGKQAKAAGAAISGYFCVVRNPISWYESWYKYQCHREWRRWGVPGDLLRWHVMAGLNMAAPADFNVFMERVNYQSPGFVSHLYSRYTLGSGALVLKTETIRDDLLNLRRKTGLALPEADILSFPKVGVSPPRPVQWEADLKRLTVTNEITAFRAYGYDTEEALG